MNTILVSHCFLLIILLLVYHLLTPHQIEQWDKIMQEYHFEEITRKGMKKRQRRILSEAGLAYNFTIDGLYRKQEEQEGMQEREDSEEKEREGGYMNDR